MRDAADAWIDDGGRAARFAGNFLWQVRLEGPADDRVQVCCESSARRLYGTSSCRMSP